MTPESCLDSCSDEICTYSIHNESKCSGSPLAGPIHQEQTISESSRPYHEKWLYLLINAPGCVLTLYTTADFSGSSQSYSGAGCHGIQQDLSTGLSIKTTAKCVEGASTPANPGLNPAPKPAPKPCYKKVQNMPKALATEGGVADACDGGIYGESCVDFPDLEEGDKCEVAQNPLAPVLLQKADCRNITVFQKLDGKVGFANVQLCGGEKSNCYIDNVCKEPTTTVTTTTITVTTSTTTTVVYECHCKVFAEGQGPGCVGKCCARENDEGGEGFDSDCSTETDETGCSSRLNGANQNFCVYKKQAYWKSLAT